jgi:hypothetical protein
MPRGPRGERHPPISSPNAAHIIRIATREIQETVRHYAVATAPGSKLGLARAQTMTPERRTQVAKLARAKISERLTKASLA